MSESASTPPVYQAFCAVQGRKVRYQVCGTGPAVLVIHGSPQSSRAVLPLVQYLASQGFCAIAPDTPGYGLSTALSEPKQTTTLNYARALQAFAKALGLAQYGLYGFHTGAAICCTLAAIAPDEVTALTCDGLTAWTKDERNTILQGYLPPFTPAWDGSHMTWLWARIEEQVAFFPWHIAEDRCLMEFDMSPVPRLHGNAMDVLEAGDGYRHAYHAAFTFVTENWLPKVSCPQLFVCHQSDPLASHYERAVFTGFNTELHADMGELYNAISQCLKQQPGTEFNAAPQAASDHNGITHGWAGKAGEALAYSGKITHQSDTPTLVLLPGAGESKALFERLITFLSAAHNVIALDLPGQGDSERLDHPPATVAEISEFIHQALGALAITNYCVAGHGLGGRIAAWLVGNHYATRGAALNINTQPDTLTDDWLANFASDLTPVWDGAHLVRAFKIARWEQVYTPWFNRTIAGRKRPGGVLEPAAIHQRAVNMLKARNAWPAAVAAETTYSWLSNKPDSERFSYYAVPENQLCDTTLLEQSGLSIHTTGAQDMDWLAALEEVMA